MDSGILPKDYSATMLLHQMLKVCKGFHRINLASDRWGCHMFLQCGVHRESSGPSSGGKSFLFCCGL